jgi:hypothetical protein
MERAEPALREKPLRQYTLYGWGKFDSSAVMLYMRICLSASGAVSFGHSDAVSREIRLLSEVEVARAPKDGGFCAPIGLFAMPSRSRLASPVSRPVAVSGR